MMKKESSRKTTLKRKTPWSLVWRRCYVMLLVMSALALSGYVIKSYHRWSTLNVVTGYLGRAVLARDVVHLAQSKIWLVDSYHTNRSRQSLKHDVDSNEPIHFHFYETLPSIQTKLFIEDHEHPLISKIAMKRLVEPVKEQINPHISHGKKIQTYVIQLGVFHHKDAAKEYTKTIQHAGFAAYVVNMPRRTQSLYKVQVGPYTDKKQANNLLNQLNQKGMQGLVVKLLVDA